MVRRTWPGICFSRSRNGAPFGVEQEGAALLDAHEYIVDFHIVGLVAGHEIRGVNHVGALDFHIPETQMGNRQAAGFFGVIGKIALGIFIGVVTDDGDGRLVGAHGSVGAKAPRISRQQCLRELR